MAKYDAAINQLQVSLDTMRNNAPINEREGNRSQAKLERANAADYTAAMRQLMQAKGMSGSKPPK